MLKSITVYSGFTNCKDPAKENDSVKWFWRILDSMTQEQLASYLQYVWGRSRLSHSFGDTHKITFKNSKGIIPEAHTCFFEVDLGVYENEQELRRKLLYAMENCTEISESSRQFRFAADFGLD